MAAFTMWAGWLFKSTYCFWLVFGRFLHPCVFVNSQILAHRVQQLIVKFVSYKGKLLKGRVNLSEGGKMSQLSTVVM